MVEKCVYENVSAVENYCFSDFINCSNISGPNLV